MFLQAMKKNEWYQVVVFSHKQLPLIARIVSEVSAGSAHSQFRILDDNGDPIRRSNPMKGTGAGEKNKEKAE